MKGAVVCVSICIADGRINGLLGCAPQCDYAAGMRVAEFTAAGIGSSRSQVWAQFWTTESQADRNDGEPWVAAAGAAMEQEAQPEGDRRGHAATHLLCLVCGGDEDYERGELGCADDLEGLWREGGAVTRVRPFPRLGASPRCL